MLTKQKINSLIKTSPTLALATKNYPSRGQTTTQELYQTKQGKLFLKRVSVRNHQDCQINAHNGSLAEREYWAYILAKSLGLDVPEVWLLDQMTTVQTWFDLPDARTFTTYQGKMELRAQNVFDCALFDWLTGQVDRHNANYLYDYINQKIILIDSANSFLKYTGSIPEYLAYFEVAEPSQLKLSLRSILQKRLKSMHVREIKRMVPLRNEPETSALLSRIKQVLDCGCLANVINCYRSNK